MHCFSVADILTANVQFKYITMRKLLLFAALVSFAALHVSAQTEETETTSQRYLRLSKTADENPGDWNAQLEIAHVLLDKSSGFYNMQRGARYYERIYHIASDFNREIPDSIFQETCIMLMTAAADKKDINKALSYIDEIKHAKKAGLNITDDLLNACNVYSIVYTMAKEDRLTPMVNIMELRERAAKTGLPGIEYTDAMTAMLLDGVVRLAMEMYGDKLLELTMGGKKYVALALNDWNIEKPLMGWSFINEKNDGEGTRQKVFYSEDGAVVDDLHGEMLFSFYCNKDGITPQDGHNVRLITVTPEQRQKMLEAYRSYIKKAKKNKK